MNKVAEGVWVTGELLTPGERTSLLTLSHENGYNEAELKSHGRHIRESVLCLPDITEEIASRLNAELRADERVDFSISEVSPSLLFCLHQPGDHVTPHNDGSREVKADTWSAFTLLVYLNDGFTGGATAFPKLGIQLEALPGRGLLFRHRILHEGKPVETGEKYVMVTFAATR